MMVESDTADLKRRLSLLEQDVEGERQVSRHILRKVTQNEELLLEVQKRVSKIENELTLLRADLPGIIAAAVAPLDNDIRLLRADLPGIIAAAVAPLLGKEAGA